VNELRDRIARLPAVEAVGLIGVAMTLVGVAVTVDALVEASRATTGAALLAWYDRLLLGLWELRIESTAWFTAGLVVLWWALAHDARLGGYRRDASRAAGGLAVGFALVAAAVAIGATIVALRGEVAGVTFTQSERLLTWLLQISTAAGAGVVWTVLAVKLPPAEALTAEEPWEEDDQEPEPEPDPPEPAAGEVLGPPPELPPPAPEVVDEPEPEPEPEPVPVAAGSRSVLDQATAIYQDRLAYSPNRDRAKELLDRVAAAERSGREDEARGLLGELSEL
jgi:hypothetical protein